MSGARTEQFDTCIKKGRGLGKASLAPIEAMVPIVEAAQPITGRGVGYKLFTAGLIPSMTDMQRVYRLLKEARERGIVPWSWIVDETRELERVAVWGNPEEYARATIRDYRRNYGTNSRFGSRSGRRKAPCAASFAPCLTITASAFGSCTGSLAQRRCMKLQMMTTADH
jgi:hypothetical protein